MLQHQTNNPENHFWQQLDQQITQIKQRHRPNNNPAPFLIQTHNSFTQTRFQLEVALHREQNEALAISNRLKYLQAQKQRQRKVLQCARRKFEYMMGLRQRSMKEKSDLKKKKEELQQQSIRVNLNKVCKIRQQRSRTSLSMRKMRLSNEKQAKDIRDLNLQIDATIKYQKQLQITNNRKQVSQTKESLARSRVFLSQIQRQKIEQAKLQHYQSIEKRIRANEIQRKRNSYLKRRLQISIEQSCKRRKNVDEQLKGYYLAE